MECSPAVLVADSSQLVEVAELTDQDGARVNNATVSTTLYDAAGAELSGATWPLALSYAGPPDGLYRGLVPAAVALSVGDVITVKIVAVDGQAQRTWRYNAIVRAA